jgi:hypothetical protein
MRSVQFLVMALTVAVVGLGIWAVHKWVPQSGLNIFGPTTSETTKKADPAPKPVTAPHKREKQRLRDVEIPVGTIVVNVPVGFPFPTPGDLPGGTTRAQLLAKYGEPSARVSGVDDGSLVERYYFVHRDRTRITIAILRNGAVASAESAINPHVTISQP